MAEIKPSCGEKPYIIGVDPGLSGAMAVIHSETMRIETIIDLPTYTKKSLARKQGYMKHIDAEKLAIIIDHYAPQTLLAVIEAPGAMPEQGLSSTFRFGHVCGQMHGLLVANYIPVMPVKPQVWKPALGLQPQKGAALTRAKKYWPHQWRGYFHLKKHHDRAEAALLVLWAKRFVLGGKV